MYIYFDNEENLDDKTIQTMYDAAMYALSKDEVNTETSSISVSFVTKDEIHELNKKFRGVDRPTDVLSFPAYEPGEIPTADEEDTEIAIGDVVICSDVAKEQAAEFGHSYERELIYLYVHSIYHLLGYDHEKEEDKVVMRAKEEDVMNYLGITR